MIITVLIMSKTDQILTSFANICIFFPFPSSQTPMALCSQCILAWGPLLCCMDMKQWKKPNWSGRRVFWKAVSQCLKLIKDMVGAHVCTCPTLVMGVGRMEKRNLKSPQQELGLSLRLPSVSSLFLLRASLPVYVSRPGRNPLQQREEMEGDPTLLPNDPAEFRDGEEEHRGPRSRGSAA